MTIIYGIYRWVFYCDAAAIYETICSLPMRKLAILTRNFTFTVGALYHTIGYIYTSTNGEMSKFKQLYSCNSYHSVCIGRTTHSNRPIGLQLCEDPCIRQHCELRPIYRLTEDTARLRLFLGTAFIRLRLTALYIRIIRCDE